MASLVRQSGKSVVIVSAKRTAVGSFHGSLASVPATELGATAARATLAAQNVDPASVEEVFFGQVLQAGVGQAPARQVALGAGMSLDTPSTTVNKVCASGMKAVMLGASTIRLGDRKVVMAGGMENMSLTPHYLNLRKATAYGDAKAIDSIQFDGLTDAYDKILMGKCSERVIKDMGLTREAQDNFAIESYVKAREAQANGTLAEEIAAVEIKGRKGTTVVDQDEECQRFFPDKFPSLRPAFDKEGSITAANASKINDGAAAMLLMEEDEAIARGLSPLARIVAYDDAAVEPYKFALANTEATKKLLTKTGLSAGDIDFHEINEAFAAVPLLNAELLGIDISKVNVHGGACAMGHPIGASGARILMALVNVLRQKDGTLGVASICNGGGGSSAVLLERMN
mmetsp:Transcript_19699/g.35045  ORF Transcript_19699/g.35045 Transcript_19699/m.35045 type:complete len:400 (+) Transcript_19699:128-1327(+)